MKIGICGCVGVGTELVNGQTIKTKEFIRYVKTRKDVDKLIIVDTWMWKQRIPQLIISFVKMFFCVDKVFLFPAHNGVKVFMPLAVLLKFIFQTKVFYMVIGGWLPKLLADNKILIYVLKYVDYICVETCAMMEDLNKLNLKNAKVVHNCKTFAVEQHNVKGENYKFRYCTFSRVMKEKGIEDAIYAIAKLNNSRNNAYILDIYGPVDEDYKERWTEMIKKFPAEIRYCGELDYARAGEVLSAYKALLFPTHFWTEGLPGSIIDAYSAGLPVIAYKWRSADEFILQNETGWILDSNNKEELAKMIEYVNDMDIRYVKNNCIEESKKYIADSVYGDMI